jgi:hypothetical protein
VGGGLGRGRKLFVGVVANCVLVTASASADHNVAERVSVDIGTSAGATPLATTADGSHVFFVTHPTGTGSCGTQVGYYYERSGGTTKPVSVGSDGQLYCGDGFLGASVDGTHVFFRSTSALTPEDTDGGIDDVYERFAGTTRLVTTGPTDPQTAVQFPSVRFSDDGSRVFFQADASLVAQDTDSADDIYERSGGTTTLRSVKSDGTNATTDETLLDISSDGSKLFVKTADQLVPEDMNSFVDLYERDEGTVKLLSDWPHAAGQQTPDFRAASTDGSRVILRTGVQLDPADMDGSIDIYELSNGQRTLLSRGSTGGSEAAVPLFRYATPDATSVWFDTTDRLTSDDLDTTPDIYKRSGGVTTLITTGPSAGSGTGALAFFVDEALNGAATYFATKEPLVPGDGDTDYDVYERKAGTTSLVVSGTDAAANQDDSRVFFGSFEQLVPGDTDAYGDIYELHDGTTTLISSSPSPAPHSNTTAVFSDDGQTVYFGTYDNYYGTDTLNDLDVYAARVGPPAPYARPKGATPFEVYLVPFYVECAGANPPNTTHGAPLSYPSCNPPKQLNTQVTIGTPDANGQPSKGRAWVHVAAKSGDVGLEAHESDIRKTSDLTDYTGQFEVALGVRQTDRDGTNSAGNGPASATLVDFPLHFAVSCAPTADTTVGSTCDIDTSANAITPGMVVGSHRTIWQLQEVQVFDGGLDGIGSTENDNLLFQVQGLFAP